MPNPKLAADLVAKATALCVEAGALADRHATYVARRDGEVRQQRLLLEAAKTHLAVQPRLAAIDEFLKTAEGEAGKNDTLAAHTALDSALKAMGEADAAKTRWDKLKLDFDTLDQAVKDLSTTAPRKNTPHIGAALEKLDLDIVALKAKLTTAPVDLDAVDGLLKDAQAQCETQQTTKLLKAGAGDPTVVRNQMLKLMNQKGGEALLDDLVKNISATDAPENILVALEVRFNLKPGNAKAEGTGANKAGVNELKRIYTVMASVPDKHTKGNPRLKQVTRKPSGGSSYADSTGNIELGDGPTALTIDRTTGDPGEVPGVEDKCKPDPSKPAPKFFDWNAQHEIGHAVDDKESFMAGHSGEATYGAWQDHGGDALTVAEAAANAFAKAGITKIVIATYLDSGTEPSPVPAGWAQVKAWADGVRSGQNPWDQGALCQKAASAGGYVLGSRVYHEAYPNHWFSYASAARTQGITGYQFRSPGEWFSELYAAYKSDVLKPAHPARVWLDKLFGTKTTP